MKLNSFISYSLVITFFMLSFNNVKAQWTLDIVGTVKKEETKKRMGGATIVVKKNGITYKTFTSPDNGKFEFSLEPDADYLIEFSKPGYVTKRIFASTKNVPPEDAKYGFEFSFEMNLFEKIEGLDVSILNKPIAKIQFNPQTGYMDYDPEYTKSIMKELEKLKDELAKKLKEKEEERKRKQQEYDKAIAEGDKAFNNEQYESAKIQYQKAAQIFPDEDYPKNQIKLIEQKLNELAALNEKYKGLIASADAAFNKKDYQKAINLYQQALNVKPKEKYPETKIAEAEKLLEELQALDEKYNEAIQSADFAFNNEEWESAKTLYQKALGLKPNEKYPQEKIDAINKKLAEIAEKNKAYNEAIAAGESLFKDNKLEEALLKYKEAKNLKPEEALPQNKIDEIQALIEEKKAKQQEFDNLMAKAGIKFNEKAYEEAKSLYQEAKELLPNEPLPKQKIDEINKILEELAKKEAEQKAKEEKYNALIEAADEFYDDKKWKEAKSKYQEALNIKNDETYPADQIKKIDDMLSQLAAQDKAYNDLIAAADKLFNEKNYESAKTKYEEALKIKEEEYPQKKIDEIENLLEKLADQKAKEAEMEENYKALISEADDLFDKKDYETSKEKYLEAIAIKNETYPNNRIKEIDKILAEIKKKKEQEELAKEAERKKREYYESLIAQADAELDNQELEKAKKTYSDASNVLPEESYPKEKIKEIENLIKKREEALKNKELIDEQYSSLILEADKLFNNQKYENAISKYQEASMLKPNEKYPKEQINKARQKLKELEEKLKQEEAMKAALAQKQEQYNNYIKKGDQAFNSKSYNEAINSYQKALSIMPNETYPKQKIDEINALLSQLKEKEKQEELAKQQEKEKQLKYDQLIYNADRDFRLKKYDEAKKAYQEALTIFPSEIYPKEKIKEIDDILAAQANQNIIVNASNNSISGNRSVDPTKEDEIEKMMAEMRAEKEQKKYEALQKEIEELKSQQKIYITASIERVNNNRELLDKQLNESRKITQEGNEKHLEKAKELELEANGYKKSVDKLNEHQAKIREKNQEMLNALEEQIRKLHLIKDKRAQQLAKELASYKESVAQYNLQNSKNQQKHIERQQKELDKQNEYVKKMKNKMASANLKQAQKIENEKTKYEKQNRKMAQNGQKIIVKAQKKNDKLAQEIKKFNEKSYSNYYKKVSKLPDYKKEIADQEFDRIQKSEKKRQENLKQIEKEKQYSQSILNKNKTAYIKHVENIRKEKERMANFNSDMQAINKEKISNVDFNYYKGEDKPAENPELAAKYKQGITEETIKNDTYIILKRTKVTGNQVDVYEKIFYNWGGTFYKKNGVDITKEIWDKEAFE